jgi:hypothetical protein
MNKEILFLWAFSAFACLTYGFFAGHTYASAFDEEFYGFALTRCESTGLRAMQEVRENRELLREFLDYYDR